MHSLIEKIIGDLITTEIFKIKNTSLNTFLEFLIEAFTNKKYVFLNSTRMANQGDIRSIYNICCKITKSFEGACKAFGFNHEYEEWGDFVVGVLQNYVPKPEKTAHIPEDLNMSVQDLSGSLDADGRKNAFAGYIDEADEAASIKRSIGRIDAYQKWKKQGFQRSGSITAIMNFSKAESFSSIRREFTQSPGHKGRTRGSVPNDEVSKLGKTLSHIKKISSHEYRLTNQCNSPLMKNSQSL
jgi:hypothetical protein